MVINKKYFTYIIFFLFTVTLFAQENNLPAAQPGQISQRKSELNRIRDEVSNLQNELKLKSAKEKESYSVLDNYNKQSFLLHRLINKLKSEEEQKESEIAQTGNEILKIKREIKSLKKNYAKYVVAIYKRGKPDEWASVLDAESFEQALLRYKYLQKFSERRQKDLAKLKENTSRLLTYKDALEKEKQEKLSLTNEKLEEEKNLEVKRDERKGILNAIRNDKAALKSELIAKKSAEIKIQNIISRLIEEAEKRRKAEEERLAAEKLKSKSSEKALASRTNEALPRLNNISSYNVDLSTAGFASFAALKGRLDWPVERGRIIRKFGENRNEKLNTVTLNYGIDIKTTSDADVRAVADGVVSAIDWLPGYGSVVIITHKGDYRTVYSHLSDIVVKEGDRVKFGSLIGRVGESLEGNILHFEIWNSRNKQNPETWLARK